MQAEGLRTEASKNEFVKEASRRLTEGINPDKILLKFVLTIEVETYSDSEIRIPAVLPKDF